MFPLLRIILRAIPKFFMVCTVQYHAKKIGKYKLMQLVKYGIFKVDQDNHSLRFCSNSNYDPPLSGFLFLENWRLRFELNKTKPLFLQCN